MNILERLDELSEQKYLRRVVSPCGRLVLYNYTDKCTFDKKWNKYTLDARGTVYELATGKVVAKAFPKFFNFQELPTSKSRNLAKQVMFSTTEKVDGSLGIIYFYDKEWHINTRGSFTSDQAIEGKKIMEQYNFDNSKVVWMTLDNITLLTEIIYPENKIIVSYGDQRKLVLLAAYNNITLEECSRESVLEIGNVIGLEVIKRYQFERIEDLIEKQASLPASEEGFVVQFEKRNERVKFKSVEYLKLARLLAYMTPLHFWEHMEGGKVNSEHLAKFPEEFREEVDLIKKRLEDIYNVLIAKVMIEIGELLEKTEGQENRRKAIGLLMKDYKHGACVFSVLDQKPEKIDSYVMKRLRPKGNEMPNISDFT